MNDESDLTRTVVDGLSVPPSLPHAASRVRARAATEERRTIRRWKRTSYVLAAISVASLVTTGVLVAAPVAASGVVDFTLTCRSELKGDRPVFDLGASPTGPPEVQNGQIVKPPPGFHPPTSLLVATADHVNLLAFSSGAGGYQLDRRRCVATKQKIELGRHALPVAGTYTRGQHLNFGSRCIVSRVVFRARIETDDTGVPVHAQVLVVRATTTQPLMYVDWTQETVHGWAARSCEKWPWLS